MKRLLFFACFTIFLGLTACQEEAETQVYDTSHSLTRDASLSVLIKRVTQQPTNFDNILDGTDACSVVLPVNITLNNQYIHVASQSDFAYVKSVKEMSTADDDVVHFAYPIQLKRPDYSEIQIVSEQQYNNFLATYSTETNNREISCVGFKFPLQVKLYNTASQVATTRSLTENRQVYNFVSSLTDNEIYSLSYPLEMQKPDGNYTAVARNSELQSFIESNINTCNNQNQLLTLTEVLTTGIWRISSYIDDNRDETHEFNGYTFVFATNQTTVATKSNVSTYGTWQSYPDSGRTKLQLYYQGGGTLNNLEEDWVVVEYTAQTIKLSHVSGGNGEQHLLTFTKM